MKNKETIALLGFYLLCLAAMICATLIKTQ